MAYKYVLFICVFFALKLDLKAQNVNSQFVIEGMVVDFPNSEPLKNASATLSDEQSQGFVKTVISNESGYFKFDDLGAGIYTLKISFTGHRDTVIAHLKVSDSIPKLSLGNIGLVHSASDLTSVTVTGRKPVVENKIDRIVYNVGNDMMAGDASELLRKVPMVTVDMDGNPSLRGNQNVQILIDGKATGAASGNIGDLLQSIPAGQIKSIEVITSPSAKYDADGSAGIINIITRKKVLEGINGSASGAIGTRQLIGNASLTGKMHKLTFDFNGGISNKWPRNIGINAYNYDALGDTSYARGNTINTRFSNNSFMTMQYDMNEKNQFSSTFHSSSVGWDDEMHEQIQSKYAGNGSNMNYGQNLNGRFRSTGFDWNADYLHRFNKKGEELDIAGQWSQNTTLQDYRSIYSGFLQGQQADNRGKNNEYTFQIDYTLPIKKVINIDAGLKSVYRNIESSYNYLIIDSGGKRVFDSLSSNKYNYQQDVLAAYIVIDMKLKNDWNIQVGTRFEATQINGKSENARAALQPFNNNYNSYVPGLIVMKKLSDQSSVKFSYNKRIQRPSLQYLNPFRNTSDPINQSQGTPDLAPEYVQTLELSYDRSFSVADLSVSAYYKHTSDLIESISKPIPYTETDQNGNSLTRMVILTNYNNIGVNNSFGLNLFGSLNFIKKLNIRGSFDLYSFQAKVDSEYKAYLNPGTFLLYDGFVSGSYQVLKNVVMESTYSFQSKRRTFQGTTSNLNVYSFGIRKTLFKGNGTIGLYAVNIFKDDWNFTNSINTPEIVQYRNLATPFRSFNLKFSYKFGNIKIKSLTQRGVNNDDLK
jgi:outer membrane receptor protein involved in Fe transport